MRDCSVLSWQRAVERAPVASCYSDTCRLRVVRTYGHVRMHVDDAKNIARDASQTGAVESMAVIFTVRYIYSIYAMYHTHCAPNDIVCSTLFLGQQSEGHSQMPNRSALVQD